MSFKHAKAVTVKTTNGQVEMKDHSLIHLLNRYQCEINTKDFVIAWNQHCLNKYAVSYTHLTLPTIYSV